MNKASSFRTKLWLYFMLFAAIIFSLLWILQTVFLQKFYNEMMEKNTKSVAEQIVNVRLDKDFEDEIDRFAYQNSLLVYITDTDGDIIYSSDSFKSSVIKGEGRHGRDEEQKREGQTSDAPVSGGEIDGSPADASGSKGQRRGDAQKGEGKGNKNGVYRELPDDYSDFITLLKNSEDGTAEYVTNQQYVYGASFELSDGTAAYLYVSVTLGAVDMTASIVRMQLIWVILLSLVIAFVIAFIIARKFSKPINQLSDQARSLGNDKYENDFKKGFCKELDELSGSMDDAAQKLNEAGEYQKELLSNVSHDLRTPLTLIKGYAEMIRDISWEDKSQRESDLGVIIKESDRLEALVNEILEYSRLRENSAKKEMKDADLGAIVSKVTERFEAIFKNSGGTIEKEIEEGCVIKGNESLLERAVYNLVDNAVKHSGESKKIKVSVYKKDKVVFEVSDSGEGIEEDDLPHIFEKYYTARQKGNKISGLGLAIVNQIALIHNAQCSVVSKKGAGSTFSLTFPDVN